MFGKRRTPSARQSLLMYHIDRPISRISSSLLLYRVPGSGSFILVKNSYSHGLIAGEYGGCSTISHCQRRKEVRDSRDVTPCIVMKNVSVLYHQVSSFSPESMRLRSLRQCKRTTARGRVQHKRATGFHFSLTHQTLCTASCGGQNLKMIL